MADTPRLNGYRTIIRSSVVKALREIFPMDIGYDDYRLDKLNVSIQYPTKQTDFPHVQVEYEDSKLETTSLGDTVVPGDDGEKYHSWMFTGDVSLEIQALNAYEIDLITDGLIIALGVDTSLQDALNDSPLSVVINTKSIDFGVSASAMGSVFDDGSTIYMSTIRIPVVGEFVVRTRPEGEVFIVEQITVTAEVE